MENHFCIYCGTQLAENAVFCTACGKKTANVPADVPNNPQYQAAAAPTVTAQSVQPPASAPQQAGTYYRQNDQPPGPAVPVYAPQPPAVGSAYTSYPGGQNYGGTVQKKRGRGLLLGGILGLVGLAIIIAVLVLMFGKPPVKKPQNTDAGSGIPSGEAIIQEAEPEASSVNGTVKKDATLRDIAGAWEGEMQMTRMEGFDKMPAEQLPPDFDDIIAKILSAPAAMELEIETDGSWYFNVDIETGMAFDSDDFDNGDVSPVLLTELENGKFSVSHSEEIDENGIKGAARIEFTGTVYENGDGLFIEGTMMLTAQQGSVSLIEQGDYSVALITAAEAVPETESETETGQFDGIDDAIAVRPDLGDFLWYLDGVYYEGLPADATPISDFADISGGWKALFYYDPDNIANAFGYDFLNVVIGGAADNASLTLDWYLYVIPDSEQYDNSEVEDTLLNGSYSQGVFSAGTTGYSIYITDFYYLNGKQYGVGYMELQSGEPTYVAFVRP